MASDTESVFSLVEVGTHLEVVVVRRRPVAERGAPQCSQCLPLPKIGNLDLGFEEGTGRVGLPVGQQRACPLQDQPAVHRNLFRCCVDHRQAGGGSTRGQQVIGGFDQQWQAGRRLSDGAGVQVRGARIIAPATGEQRQTAGCPGVEVRWAERR